MAIDLTAQIEQFNIAENLDEKTAKDIAQLVYEGYLIDQGSRHGWLDKHDEYLKLATQIAEKKNYPWANASNIKYPLLTIAALQFAARAYQTLFPNADIVKTRVVGADPQGAKAEKALRISKYMSYQLLEEDECWEDGMDRLCISLPILGNMFKKTYRCDDYNKSDLILPKDLVVNFYAKSLDAASRKTHILYFYPNIVEEKIRSGEFLEHKINKDQPSPAQELPEYSVEFEGNKVQPPDHDPDTPLVYLEQHRCYDLDGDGYEEPYIATISLANQELVRLSARYDRDSIKVDDRGRIVRIEPTEYFTNYIFIPDPTSGVYGLSFGSLLGPLNEGANTIINQLMDSGTLNNLQSGFIGRGVRIPNGDVPLAPGEWRYVPVAGDKLKDNIIPLPTKEPSQVLYTLLGMLVESGFNIGSINETMMGKNPGQNQPFSTTSEVIKQGQQVFSAIHKRLHRALKKEFRKIYRLNKLYLDETKYFIVLDTKSRQEVQGEIAPSDFTNDTDFDVFPASDPTQLSSVERIEKANLLLNLIPTGHINGKEAVRQVLEGARFDDIDILMTVPEPQPNFDQQIELGKIEIEKERLKQDGVKIQYQGARDEANSIKAMAEAQAIAMDAKTKEFVAQFNAMLEAAKLKLESAAAGVENKMKLLEEQNKLLIAKASNEAKKQASSTKE